MDKALLPAVGCALLFVLCNLLTKKSLDEGYEWMQFLVYGTAVLSFVVFRIVCKNYGLIVASGIVDSLLTILTIVIGFAIFREPVTAKQVTGIVLLLGGLYLVH